MLFHFNFDREETQKLYILLETHYKKKAYVNMVTHIKKNLWEWLKWDLHKFLEKLNKNTNNHVHAGFTGCNCPSVNNTEQLSKTLKNDTVQSINTNPE